MTATDRILDGLVADTRSDATFWVLLVSVGVVALLIGLKHFLHEPRRGHHFRHDRLE